MSFNIVSYQCSECQISLQAALQIGGESKVDKILMSFKGNHTGTLMIIASIVEEEVE